MQLNQMKQVTHSSRSIDRRWPLALKTQEMEMKDFVKLVQWRGAIRSGNFSCETPGYPLIMFDHHQLHDLPENSSQMIFRL